MAFEIYDTTTMMEIVNEKKAEMPSTFFLSRYFPQVMTFDTSTINFDLVSEEEDLAPFVSPVVQGKVMANEGFTTKMFAPAYVKPKHVVDPDKIIKRRAGEAITGGMSLDARYRRAVEDNVARELRMVQRRLEQMAALSAINGSITISGENYPLTNVSFGRDAGQTVALASGAFWTVSGLDILGSIEDLRGQTQDRSGYAPTDLFVSTAVWKVMRANSEFSKLFELQRGADAVRIDLGLTEADQGIDYKGSIGSVNIFVLSAGYKSETTGLKVPYLASNQIFMASSGVEGVRSFGAIMDAKAGYTAAETFSKMWLNEDPSVTYTMTQSAPLMVPRRANATLLATVMA